MKDNLVPWWMLGAALVIIMLFVVPASSYAEDFWHVDMPGYSAPVVKARASSAEQLSILCGMPRAADSACSIRTERACIVHLGPEANACAESHEVNGHCKGKNHRLTYGLVQDCAYPPTHARSPAGNR